MSINDEEIVQKQANDIMMGMAPFLDEWVNAEKQRLEQLDRIEKMLRQIIGMLSLDDGK